ncbi:DUF5610 domain-containing protein [Thioalkalivibrio sp. ALJ16]|uniref:DUF5610 domain-containing protein n=1 Tax=Thioalkalivibrio sp. ALJ16 TaxID=1158762 RepID=UPI00035C853D|nr:DUF5610 domain-containing protein [Thioalkalivibrio sp. ALJ16]
MMIDTPVAASNRTIPASLRAGSEGPGAGPAGGPSAATRSLTALQNQLLHQLAQHLPGQSPGSLKRLDANDFTPEKVAERIVGFVELGLAHARARGASEAELGKLKEQAVAGVEQGFREAREILSGLNLLNGQIAADVDETERLIFAGLEELRTDPMATMPPEEARFVRAERFQRAESLELNIQTRSGAEVRIEFQSVQDARAQLALETGADGAGAWMDVSRYQESGFSFSVQGSLDADEIRAVQGLVRDIGQVADEFFNGDVQQAFAMLPDLRFDREQLKSMDLRMTRTEVYRMAQAYEQTQKIDAPEQSAPVRRLGQLIEALRESLKTPELPFAGDALTGAGPILQTLVEQDTRFKTAAAAQQEAFRKNLERLLDAVRG